MAPVQIIANHMRQEQEESFIRRLRTYNRKYSDTPGKPPFISWASTFCVLTLLAFHKELTSPPLFMYHFTVTRRNISFPILRNLVHFPLGTDCFSSFHPPTFSSHVLVGFLSLLHHRRDDRISHMCSKQFFSLSSNVFVWSQRQFNSFRSELLIKLSLSLVVPALFISLVDVNWTDWIQWDAW